MNTKKRFSDVTVGFAASGTLAVFSLIAAILSVYLPISIWLYAFSLLTGLAGAYLSAVTFITYLEARSEEVDE